MSRERWIRTVLVGMALIASGPWSAPGARAAEAPWQPPVPAPDLDKVRLEQRLDAQIPLDLPFTDETGQRVTLGQYCTDQPVILVLAYYRCPMLCTLVLNDLAKAMSQMPLKLGQDYRVVTVSFDPQETSALAAAKRQHYLESFKGPGSGDGWHFLTGDEDAITKLTQAVGFHYVYDAEQKQYLHPSGITILTPSGKISRYFFGIDYSPRDLRLALIEASSGTIGTRTDQILLYCFHYNPSVGKYTPSVLNFVRIGGVVVMAVLGGFFWYLKRGEGRRRASRSAPPASPKPPGGPP